MEYSDKKARRLQQKHSLSEITIKVWKSRNYIPEQYGQRGFKRPVKADPDKLIKMEKILKIKGIRRAAFESIHAHRLQDFLRGGGNAAISDKEAASFFKEGAKLKKATEKFLSKPDIDSLGNFLSKNKTLKVSLLINDHKVYDRFRKGYNISSKEMTMIKRNIQKLYKNLDV